MVILPREEAIVFASFLRLMNLTEEEREIQMQDALDDLGIEASSESEKSITLRKYIEQGLSCYTNKYIKGFITNKLNLSLEVSGSDVRLYSCPCCGYMTLKELGEYFICAVCYWEDDGTITDITYSSVNNMTLGEARDNFYRDGVILEKYKNRADTERFIKYALSTK
jgi:hypothetical protein